MGPLSESRTDAGRLAELLAPGVPSPLDGPASYLTVPAGSLLAGLLDAAVAGRRPEKCIGGISARSRAGSLSLTLPDYEHAHADATRGEDGSWEVSAMGCGLDAALDAVLLAVAVAG